MVNKIAKFKFKAAGMYITFNRLPALPILSYRQFVGPIAKLYFNPSKLSVDRSDVKPLALMWCGAVP